MLLASPFTRSQFQYWTGLLMAALLASVELAGCSANQTAGSAAPPSAAPMVELPNQQVVEGGANNSRQVIQASTPPPAVVAAAAAADGNTSTTSTRMPYETMKALASQLGYTPLGDSPQPTKERARSGPAQVSGQVSYALPSWFNYQLYKRFHGKRYAREADDEAHKRIYLRTALKVFEQRALYRLGRLSSLSSVNELSDLSADELEAFKARDKRAGWRHRRRGKLEDLASEQLAGCCTYDQVYKAIIERLNATSGADLALSRAYIDELEQKPFAKLFAHQTNEDPLEANDSSSLGRTEPIDWPNRRRSDRLPNGQHRFMAAQVGVAEERSTSALMVRPQANGLDAGEGELDLGSDLDSVEQGGLRDQLGAARCINGDSSAGCGRLAAAAAAAAASSVPRRDQLGGQDKGEGGGSSGNRAAGEPQVAGPPSLTLPIRTPDYDGRDRWRGSLEQPGGGRRNKTLLVAPDRNGTSMTSAANTSGDTQVADGKPQDGPAALGLAPLQSGFASGSAPVGGSKAASRGFVSPAAPPDPAKVDTELAVAMALDGALEKSVRRQVAEQLGANSPIGRQLVRQFSAYFGQPVVVSTELEPVAEASKDSSGGEQVADAAAIAASQATQTSQVASSSSSSSNNDNNNRQRAAKQPLTDREDLPRRKWP